MIRDKLSGKLPAVSGDVPEAVSFDGVTDYMSRSSDLVGNVDSKTFTFSCWVYNAAPKSATPYDRVLSFTDGTATFRVSLNNNTIAISGTNSAGNQILGISNLYVHFNTYSHIVVSVDLLNGIQNTYINDVFQIPATMLTNDIITFTQPNKYIGSDAVYPLKGRLSNLFLSYDYIDLSVVANRRIFITEDGTAVT